MAPVKMNIRISLAVDIISVSSTPHVEQIIPPRLATGKADYAGLGNRVAGDALARARPGPIRHLRTAQMENQRPPFPLRGRAIH
jgi:hypothetical protein